MSALRDCRRWFFRGRIEPFLLAVWHWSVKYRVALTVGLIQTVAVVALERWDSSQSTEDYYTKGAPFLLVSVLGCLLIVTLLTQERRKPGPWWRVWDRLDPWTGVLAVYTATITGYTTGLFSGFGTPFQTPVIVYDYLRIGLFLSGFFGVPLTSLLIEYRWHTWRDRARQRPDVLDDDISPDGLP